MSAIAFDSLDYFDKLKNVGVPEAQARVQADALRTFATEHIATKSDIVAIKADLKATEDRLRSELREMEYRLMLRLGAMLAGAVTILGALTAFLAK